jgi:hypothetical protein
VLYEQHLLLLLILIKISTYIRYNTNSKFQTFFPFIPAKVKIFSKIQRTKDKNAIEKQENKCYIIRKDSKIHATLEH